MTARTHDAFAFASLVTVATIYPPVSLNLATMFTSIVGNIVGALTPDLDQASNRLWDLLPAGNVVGKILRPLLLGHRTLSHSILGGVIYYKVLEFVLPKILNASYVNIGIVTVSIMIGFISHLIADSLTKEGIPLFFPFKMKIGIPPVSFMRITTGGFIENVLILPVIAIYLIWLVNTKKEILLSVLKLLD
ncbi:hypothetical protein A2961_00625 [Candidatus Woesebacteria bacterium RIFCSPLOWO2_01_FULL_39_21]|uniref:Membrane protein containing DUF457, transmembrane n=1 Tax=Candidatus Woesebacteria bacterium RIFCSPLOWO2_01_FULL_39_21 TaxID=1802519 RepID=A0A1F8BBS4_9BACT|nr:MAG: hypothetical protein A2961_00625 [Candidatus Woesebacteria bacterium RIFCSPLOWO2_01_FULL_39_21]